MDLILSVSKELDHTFRWRQGGDRGLIKPASMKTGHLLNTLTMIWNHNMPAGARTHDYKEYSFGPFYTDAYMKRAIRALALELATRKDMTAVHIKKLNHMLEYLKRNQINGLTNVYLN